MVEDSVSGVVDDSKDWIFDAIINYLKSPKWKEPMISFIEANCLVFDEEDENKFEYSKIHEVLR